jgi:hypothetical protein
METVSLPMGHRAIKTEAKPLPGRCSGGRPVSRTSTTRFDLMCSGCAAYPAQLARL